MNEQLAVLEDVVSRLDGAGIPYMVSGSMALNYYGPPRMTRDIDLVVELAPGSVSGFIGAFAEGYYLEPDAVGRAASEQGMFNLIRLDGVVKVDFIVRKNTEYRRLEFSRRRRVRFESVDLFIVSAEDLILSKLEWARDSRSDLQLGDVRGLLAAAPGLDRAYLDDWAARLGLRDLLAELEAGKG